MKDILVSIIVPIFNMEKYLVDCVNSLLNQTYKNIEILLINDGSTDNSPTICDEIVDKDKRIRVFHKENGGTATARNLGIEQANGEYLTFIDPDDYLSDNTIEVCVNKIIENNLDVVRFNYVKEFTDYSEKKKNTLLSESVIVGEDCKTICRKLVGLIGEELRSPESQNFLASVCFSLYKKSVITENDIKFTPMQEIASFSDGLFNIEVYAKMSSFLFIDEAFYHYRKDNNESCTSKYRANFMPRQLVLFDKIENIIKDFESEDFLIALNNRIALSSREMCYVALQNKTKFKVKYAEVKSILKNKKIRECLKNSKLKNLPFKWKVYYFFAKHKMALGVYFLTCIMKKIREGRN